MIENIEYYGNDEEVRKYRLVQRSRAKRLNERYKKNREVLRLAEEYEEFLQKKAFAEYQKKRAEQKRNSDRDAELYHLEVRR